jgi:hypothetical protein
MLKMIFTILLFAFTLSAFACWKVEGQLSVDGESFKIHQKVDHKKEYLFPLGTFILKMTFDIDQEKNQIVRYALHEKKGTTQTFVTKGEEILTKNKSNDIYAKGETGQPNSIITLKLIDI